MSKKYLSVNGLILAALMILEIGLITGPVSADQAESANDNDIQVLASGPIHEAFAEAAVVDPEPGITVPKKPPAQIEEIPPSEKPEGDVQWIPGYWGWDDDRNDFIWISGIWRVAPPDRQWIPGYWNAVSGGYQWISGYWASNEESEVTYLPEPPESVEAGPNSPAPSSDYIWIPGCWLWNHGRYAWRPGYWATAYPDWIWVPAYYSWTPRGFIFVSGYWDFNVIHRGILFAPVIFPVFWHVGVVHHFRPHFTVNLSIFDDALFVRPGYHHYYFGDYYAPVYYRRGIYPWFSPHARLAVHDPIYVHQRWNHRNDRDWQNRMESEYQKRRANEALRPPRFYDPRMAADQARRSSVSRRPEFIVPLEKAGSLHANRYRFQPLSDRDRRTFTQREGEIGNYRMERQQREIARPVAPKGVPAHNALPERRAYSRSPIEGHRSETNDQWHKPPARQREPGLNTNVEPLQRWSGRAKSRDDAQELQDNRSGSDPSRRYPSNGQTNREDGRNNGSNGRGPR